MGSDLQKIRQRYLTHLLVNPRFATLFVTITNLLFISLNVFRNQTVSLVDCGHLAIAVSSLALILPSYWNPKYNKLVRFGFMLCILRQSTYFFDLNPYREKYSFERWFFSCQLHQFVLIYGLSWHFFYFNPKDSGHTIYSFILILVIFLSFLSSVKPLGEWDFKETDVFSLMAAFLVIITGSTWVQARENFHQTFVDSLMRHVTDHRFMRLVMDSNSEGIVVFDSEKRVVYSNSKFRDFFSRERDQYSSSSTEESEDIFPVTSNWLGAPLPSPNPKKKIAYYSESTFFREVVGVERRTEPLSLLNILAKDIINEMTTYEVARSGSSSDSTFVRLKRQEMRIDDQTITMLQFIDVSKSILYSQIQQQNELLSLLNATISHELRNPLNSIVGQNQILLCQLEALEAKASACPKRILEDLSRMKQGSLVLNSSAKMMNFLVSDFLDYAQIKSSKFRVNLKPFNIQEATADVVLIQQKKAVDQGIALNTEFSGFEAAPDGTILNPIVRSDEHRFKQVLLNLLSNALKFTQKGSVDIRVELQESTNDFAVQVSVKDTGVGIPYEDQHKLFKLFGFIQSTEQMNKNGIGLGLVISEKIVNQLGGTIGFRSKPQPEKDHGSTFWFTIKVDSSRSSLGKCSAAPQMDPTCKNNLVYAWEPPVTIRPVSFYQQNPVMEDIEEEKSPERILKNTPFKRFSLNAYNSNFSSALEMNRSEIELLHSTVRGQKKILIVDDQVFNIQAVTGILEYLFKIPTSRLDSATNGSEACQIIRSDFLENGESSYALILMDCNMPFMDGFEATKAIRTYFWEQLGQPQIEQPIIVALTGHVEPQYVEKCFTSGMNQVLSKPVEREALRQMLALSEMI